MGVCDEGQIDGGSSYRAGACLSASESWLIYLY